MVDQSEVNLKIIIKYQNVEKEINLQDLISVDELKDRTLKMFEIPNNKKQNFFKIHVLRARILRV